MFAKAYKIASSYTHPVITSVRTLGGDTRSGIAAFVVLNDDGWALTAGHVGMQSQELANGQQLGRDYTARLAAIKNDSRLNAAQKRRNIGELARDDDWATDFSFWWGDDGAQAQEFRIDPLRDLALVKLSPFPEALRAAYPVFKQPEADPACGTSLCRLGFPFYGIESKFVEERGSFELAPGTLPVPRFPIDGILTRLMIKQDAAWNRKATFIETSSPGLRGQSGGPISMSMVESGDCKVAHRPSISTSTSTSVAQDSSQSPRGSTACINIGHGAYASEILAFLRSTESPIRSPVHRGPPRVGIPTPSVVVVLQEAKRRCRSHATQMSTSLACHAYPLVTQGRAGNPPATEVGSTRRQNTAVLGGRR